MPNVPAGGLLVVDAHAHHFPSGLHAPARSAADPRWPRLEVNDGGLTGRLMRGADVFRPVTSGTWDVPTRLAAMDAAGVDLQVISPVPVTLSSWADAKDAAEFLRSQNDLIAAAAATSGGRLQGLGAVPLQHAGEAVAELRRVTSELGLAGVEIGTCVGDLELDDPALRPFFAAAQESGVPLFVHPVDGSGATRRSGQPYEFGVGMLTDTALAASALVFGGVLDDFPGLKVALSHGCGAFPWTYPRTAASAMGDPQVTARLDRLVRSLWADTLVFDPQHLRLVASRFGADHLMLGSDYPFMRDSLRAAKATIDDAVTQQVLSRREADQALGLNAIGFFGLDLVAAPE
jgi:aminocarboxymuconate-semialdehyde decarboxylase